jgi:hypothetical protein
MKKRKCFASVNIGMVRLVTELGKADLIVSVADKDLNWSIDVKLDAATTADLVKFLNENVIG